MKVRLPLGFEVADLTSDPLIQLLLRESEEDADDHAADQRESEVSSMRDSVLVKNTLEEHGDVLTCRTGNTSPGPCIVVFRRK